MARAEKQTALTPEERLELALVPDWEQPYKVPENWVWTKLGSLLTEIKNGTTVKQDKSGEGYSVTRIESLQHNTIDFDRLGIIIDESQIKETDWYTAGDVTLSHINSVEHVGKTALINEDMLPLVHGMNLLRLRFNKACLPILFQYYSQSFQYKTEIISRINMAVNQVSINQKQLGTLEIPLPPLVEQQRIVNCIESLFAKLNEAKEKALAALDSFETRKAAILYKALTGELTDRWRNEHGVGMESWGNFLFGTVIKNGPQNGLYKPKSDYNGDGDMIVRINNFYDGIINPWSTLKRLNLSIEEIETYGLRNGDILVNRVNSMSHLGKSALVRNLTNVCVFESNMMRIEIDTSVAEPEYIIRYLNSTQGLAELRKNAKQAVNQASINQQDVKNAVIRLSSLLEQQEIIRLLNDLLAKEQQTKEAVFAVLDRIDLIKKSILARAFRGELGTNDPTEESVVELLKHCLAQQANEQVQALKRKSAPAVVLSNEVRSQLSSKLERDIYLLLKKNGHSNIREIASISKKDLDMIEAIRQLEKKGLIQKQLNGEYSCVR